MSIAISFNEFESFPKIPRLNRQVTITEKIDGTNAQVTWFEINCEAALSEHKASPYCLGIYPGLKDGDSAMALYAGSRNRWLTGGSAGDNFGFGKWVVENAEDLRLLGPGRHFGEWWGLGIQRGYGQTEKKFSLFNVHIWEDGRRPRPACCGVVPLLFQGVAHDEVNDCLSKLRCFGSTAAPGFMDPEGIVVWHSATRGYTKVTCKNDDQPKGKVEEA